MVSGTIAAPLGPNQEILRSAIGVRCSAAQSSFPSLIVYRRRRSRFLLCSSGEALVFTVTRRRHVAPPLPFELRGDAATASGRTQASPICAIPGRHRGSPAARRDKHSAGPQTG
jgi:hypothetical protein